MTLQDALLKIARKEAAIRSVWTGEVEYPGRLPPSPGKFSDQTTQLATRQERIIAALKRNGSMYTKDICDAVGSGWNATHETLRRMRAEGVITSTTRGRITTWQLADRMALA